jgi:N-formylglutamate deformylase
MDTYTLLRGDSPLLVSLPHDGGEIPCELVPRLTPAARAVPDTDWHVSRLYAFAGELGASVLIPRYSRYVVDLNRPPDDTSLYPGQNTTGLCPTTRFDGGPVYHTGEEPGPDEIERRVERYWRPYHTALADELRRIRADHGRVVLWEGHSIAGRLPFLFDGALPALNIGTVDGSSCSGWLQDRLVGLCSGQGDYDWVINGRFKGGYITRRYGRPADGVQAVQLEIAQSAYMDEETTCWLPERAARLQRMLRQMLEVALA